MRMRKKPNLAVRMERCSHIITANPTVYRGHWLEVFGYSELRIELGCGKGRFTVDVALSEPDVLFVALEKNASVMVIALERALEVGLQNVRFINAFAESLMEYFMPGEISRFYINFCDPWPSNRHTKRRLTNERFLSLYSQLLTPEGEVHFKTDDLQLFEFSLREFKRCGFKILEQTRHLHSSSGRLMTDYELRFAEQGIPIYECTTKNTVI